MSLLFRRKSAATSDDIPETVEPVSPQAGKNHTPAKGRPTPKRSEAGRARKAVVAPTDKKEAKAQMRARLREERSTAYAGQRRGDDKYLTARDKGPVRRLVRDLVDSRRNVGSYFLVSAFVVLLFSQPQWPAPLQFGAKVLWLLIIVAILLDVFLISRMVRKEVRARFPDAPDRLGSLAFYGVMRSVQFRRMRTPSAQVKVGEKV